MSLMQLMIVQIIPIITSTASVFTKASNRYIAGIAGADVQAISTCVVFTY